MDKKKWIKPELTVLGSVEEFTRENPTIDKCGGSADNAYPQILSPNFAGDCPDA